MKIPFTIAFVFFLFLTASAQELTCKSRGRVFANNKELAPDEIRTMFATRPYYLEYYNAGRNKKSIGNTFLIIGSALVAADLATGLTQDKVYPSALTFVGAAAILIAIPVKIGYSRKIRKAVEGFNSKAVTDATKIETLTLCANQNGVGFKITY